MSWSGAARKIVAIGRNYAEHAKELGNPLPKQPMLFLKPTSSIVGQPGNIELPKGAIVHHELELGVVIGKTGRNISASKAWDYVQGYSNLFYIFMITSSRFRYDCEKYPR